ncbi:MAG: hypothetical protein LBS19_01390, partial [Clostridiales bacterium]|nr:hypothetical protein [Clostridiales bacterium]
SATPTPIANVRITTHAYPNYTGANVTANWQTGTNYYPRGTNVTLRASDTFAYAGITYYFQGWYENGYRISSSNTCNITANNDRDITAQYDDEMGDDYVYFWTDSNPQYGGTTNLDRNGGVTYYKKGETVWIQATPSEGYEFIGWYIGNKTFFSSSASTFFAANSSMGITARFKWTGGGGTQ